MLNRIKRALGIAPNATMKPPATPDTSSPIPPPPTSPVGPEQIASNLQHMGPSSGDLGVDTHHAESPIGKPEVGLNVGGPQKTGDFADMGDKRPVGSKISKPAEGLNVGGPQKTGDFADMGDKKPVGQVESKISKPTEGLNVGGPQKSGDFADKGDDKPTGPKMGGR